MKKINIENLSIKYFEDSYIYVIEVKEYNYFIKRIKCTQENKEFEFITLKNGIAEVKKIIYDKNKKNNIPLSNIDKINIINSIFSSIQNNRFSNDIFNISELKKQIKDNFINIIIANCTIGLSCLEDSKCAKYFDIILLEDEEIIGNITINKNNLKIEVDEFYYEKTIKLLENYLSLFRTTKKLLKEN